MRRIAAIVLFTLLLANPADLSSCGPFFPAAVFISRKTPDNERAFYAGNLGIVQPSFEPQYLAMAYRILSGEPLNTAQIDSVVDLDRYRTPDVDDQLKQWLAARHRVPGAEAIGQLDPYRQSGYETEMLVCGPDAFATARKTLDTLIRDAGANSQEVRNWLQAQDRVFVNCSSSTFSIPDPAPATAGRRAVTDREYQVAAAHFYSGNYQAAIAEWQQIAGEKDSRWHVWAPYLIARAYLRQEKMNDAVAQLERVLADPTEAPIRAQTQSLLDYVQARIDPAARFVVVSNRIMLPHDPNLGRDLNDYVFLFRISEYGYASIFDPAESKARFDRFQDAISKSGVSTWIARLASKSSGPAGDEYQRWQKTKSLAWLLVASRGLSSGSPELQNVLDALEKVDASSPGYVWARFQAAEILMYAKRSSDASKILDELLSSGVKANLDSSTSNQL